MQEQAALAQPCCVIFGLWRMQGVNDKVVNLAHIFGFGSLLSTVGRLINKGIRPFSSHTRRSATNFSLINFHSLGAHPKSIGLQ